MPYYHPWLMCWLGLIVARVDFGSSCVILVSCRKILFHIQFVESRVTFRLCITRIYIACLWDRLSVYVVNDDNHLLLIYLEIHLAIKNHRAICIRDWLYVYLYSGFMSYMVGFDHSST